MAGLLGNIPQSPDGVLSPSPQYANLLRALKQSQRGSGVSMPNLGPSTQAGDQVLGLTGSPALATAAHSLHPMNILKGLGDWGQYVGDQTVVAGSEMGLPPSLTGALATGAELVSDPSNLWPAGKAPLALAGLGMAAASPRMSRAAAEAAGYWHPISKTKLPRPFHEITSTRYPDADIQVPPRDFILPEALEGNVIIPATGDRTAAAMYLSGVNGMPFEQAVKLSGGPDFMRTHGSSMNPDLSTIWAAAPGVTKQLYDKARSAADLGMDSALMYMPMGYRSSDFSTMMIDSLLEQMKAGKITKKLKREFDSDVREIRPEWKGIDHPESRAQVDNNGELRKVIIGRMGIKKYQQGGFPDLGSTRASIMEPDLLDTPSYAGGFSIGRLDPTRPPTMEHPMPHASYPSQVHGNYLGGFEVPLPLHVMFPDFYNARRAAGKDPSKDIRSFQLSHPSQKADAMWVDQAMNYMESNR